MPTNENHERNDDWEEFGEDMGIENPIVPPTVEAPLPSTAPTVTLLAGMIGTCNLCGKSGGVPQQCIRDDGSVSCPHCGGDMTASEVRMATPEEMIDLTRGVSPGSTGRCNNCGLLARVFGDVVREDGTAGCEMCESGTFEFMYGLPASATRAPAPVPAYVHEVDGLTLKLRRRVDLQALRRVLSIYESGTTPESLLNSDDEEIQRFLSDNNLTIHTLKEIKKVENERRWKALEPLLYTAEEKETLNQYVMLRLPFPGRVRITFAGSKGPVHRWVSQIVFEDLLNGDRELLFDGHYKAVLKSTIEEEPRFEVVRQLFPQLNGLASRGILKAISPTGEEIPLPSVEHTDETTEPEQESENG